ncbi:MAG TPA: nucleotidyltransferase family protein [Blastocatellia bacterium]|nr:nucleotidyltransferase family protein [Blastocatellia bacterium]
MRAPLGEIVARVLRGAWRRNPPELEILEDELDEVAPLLLACGAGALGWWRVRDSNLRDSPTALELQQAYRLHSLQSAVHESEIKHLLTVARDAGAEPVLVKGWAAAMLYPEMGLRPYGDIDLCFEEKSYGRAAAAFEGLDRTRYQVDLHDGFSKLDDLSTEELLSRSETIWIGGESVRVLGVEDQLRIQCTHALRHSAWRPLWFCDIAAAVESRSVGFDWDRCLGPDARKADWVACAIGLAHQFLGAEVQATPVEPRANQLPSWLVRRTLKNWSAPYPGLYPPLSYTRPIRTYFRDPRGLWGTLRMRWPDPIEATIRMQGPFNELPRLPYQLGNAFSRIVAFLRGYDKSDLEGW